MIERKQRPGRHKLPLPSPRSPGALDDKILAYARDHAPEKQIRLAPRWAAGLATAGVVVVALFLTVPQQRQAITTAKPGVPALQEIQNYGGTDLEVSAPRAALQARKEMPYRAMRPAPEENREGLADEELVEAKLAGDAMAAADASPTSTAERIDRDDLAQQLHHLAQLLRQGEEQQARAMYDKLRRACPACALPATLEQAIAATKKTDGTR
jgi:hypothetical protein